MKTILIIFPLESKVAQAKSSANLLNSSLDEIPEQRLKSNKKKSRAQKNRMRIKEGINLTNNLKDIEKRILLKMKANSNKTDRNPSAIVMPTLNKDQRPSRYLQSPGSDKPDNSFPKLANSSITSAYSSPYGKHTENESDMRIGKFQQFYIVKSILGMNKEHIHDAMSRIKKSIARSQSIRNTDLTQGANNANDEYSYNRRENPYDTPNPLQYPEVYKSKNAKSKIDIKSIKANMSKLFDNKSVGAVNKRYELETADSTDSSFGYKFLKKTPSRGHYSDIIKRNRKFVNSFITAAQL